MNTFTTRSNYKELNDIFKIVETFIIDNKLILYGGMAIDYAMKLVQKDGIYDDITMPDYDFYSSDIIETGKRLVDILLKDYDNVMFFGSAHLTSITVKYRDVALADIGFVPEDVLVKIPTLEYNKLRIVHPSWQKLDMYKSFNTPYYGFPRENYTHRFKKDMTRLVKLDTLYPDTNKPIKTTKSKLYLNHELCENNLLSGVFAYAVIYKYAKSMVKLPSDILESVITRTDDILECIFDNLDTKVITELVSCNPERLIPSISKIRYFSPFLDDLLPKNIIGEYKSLPIKVYFPNVPITKFKGKLLDIVSIQGLLYHFLAQSFHIGGVYLHYYTSLKKIIQLVDEQYVPDEYDVTKYPFYLSVNPYCKFSIYEKTKISQLKKQFGEDVKDFRVQPTRYNGGELQEYDGYYEDLILFKLNNVELENFDEYDQL